MLLKCCTQYVSRFEKPSSGHRTGKGQFSSQFPRRAEVKNVQTTGQLHSSPMLVRLCSKSSKLGFSITWTKNFQILNLGLEKASSLGINKCPHTSVGKESACNAGDLGSIPGLGRSPGEGNGNPLQYSSLGNPMVRGVWRATVHGVSRVGHSLATKLTS